MTDYTKMDGPALLEACGDRADLWAEALRQEIDGMGMEISNLTPEFLSSWFRGAIEQSHTVRMRRHLAEPSPTWREEAERPKPATWRELIQPAFDATEEEMFDWATSGGHAR